MNYVELSLTAFGLSMDAFAVAICIGLTLTSVTPKKCLIVGAYFGLFQAGMPLIGYFAATLFADDIISYDHWIAFGVLCILGGRMIAGAFQKQEQQEVSDVSDKSRLTFAKMLPLAIATSIDAMAVGVSFAFLKVSIVPAVLLIGIITLAMSFFGVKIGRAFGAKLKSKAEIAGGVILVLIGIKILLEHLEVI
ncbi:MAG: manganese efflux pump MntP family protein [Oscillospiraceae bacterium]|nr:manganese efflux pump MntP family protein [Oscillospiraceae bacterium]